MRKKIKTLIALACVVIINAQAFAATDERGVFGGISSGVPLPKTTEQLLASTKTNKRVSNVMDYSEMVFLTGKPLSFKGTLTATQNGTVSETDDKGSYTVTYAVVPDVNNAGDVQIFRNMTLKVNYRKVVDSGVEQVILDYNVTNWSERIVVGGSVYTIVPSKSYFGRSIIKDITPGVSYYKGYTSVNAHYVNSSQVTTVAQSGTVYGYDCPWSKTETERVNVTVQSGDGWQLEAQIRPSVAVNKLIQYSPNEPTAISFDGNYYEVTKNQSALAYNIYSIPKQFEKGTLLSGAVSIPNVNKFEMLPAPDLAFIKGHYAETDIRKLFAMQVFSGETSQFQPAQAMTRAQFVTGLVKAFKLPVEQPATTTSRSRNAKNVVVLFPDVDSNRSDFPYLMSAYNHGLVYGKYSAATDNKFRPDDTITMEEAVTLLMRGLGLENLGLANSTVTVFADDGKISSWAKREVAAAYKIGIVDMDANGNLNPGKKLTKAEGSAIINRLIDYMRSGLPVDYSEHILNFAN